MYNQHYDTVKGKHKKLRFHGVFREISNNLILLSYFLWKSVKYNMVDINFNFVYYLDSGRI